MQTIELETMIDQDGNLHLPERYRFSFGKKAWVIVLLSDNAELPGQPSQADKLMAFSGTIDWPIADPVEFQRQLRSEWDREWD